MSGKLSRRGFMKMSAAAAGAFAGSQLWSAPQSVMATAHRQSLASHVTIGNTSLQPNLNPYYFTYFQSRQLYDTLIDVDANGNLIPGLATEWNRVDAQTVELKLRDDVFFSNGERFTANSVAVSLQHLLTVGVNNLALYGIPLTDFQLFPPQFALFNEESIEVIDDTNVVVRATRPDAILENRLARFWMLSEQFLNEFDGELTTEAAGTGYFRVVEFLPGERIELERWEGNWRGDYPIQTATYVRVGDVRSALESGDIDIAQNLPPDIARTLESRDEWNVSAKPSLATEIISMIPTSHEALLDVRVRKALTMAIDKDAYNEIVQGGFATPTTGQLLRPEMDGYNDELERLPYDPNEAIRLLQEAGYANLELDFAAPNTLRAQAEVLAGFFESIGVRINLETPDSGTLIGEIRAGTERDLILWNTFYTTLQDWSQAMVGLAPQDPNAQRHIASDEFYQLNAQINMEGDPEARNALIRDASRLLNEEASVIFLSWMDTWYVHTSRIDAIPFNLDNSPRIYEIEMRT